MCHCHCHPGDKYSFLFIKERETCYRVFTELWPVARANTNSNTVALTVTKSKTVEGWETACRHVTELRFNMISELKTHLPQVNHEKE